MSRADAAISSGVGPSLYCAGQQVERPFPIAGEGSWATHIDSRTAPEPLNRPRDFVTRELGRYAARALVARGRYGAGVVECPPSALISRGVWGVPRQAAAVSTDIAVARADRATQTTTQADRALQARPCCSCASAHAAE